MRLRQVKCLPQGYTASKKLDLRFKPSNIVPFKLNTLLNQGLEPWSSTSHVTCMTWSCTSHANCTFQPGMLFLPYRVTLYPVNSNLSSRRAPSRMYSFTSVTRSSLPFRVSQCSVLPLHSCCHSSNFTFICVIINIFLLYYIEAP